MLVIEDIRDYTREILEDYVTANNISHAKAAENLGVSKATFSRLWNKKLRITESEFKKYFHMCKDQTDKLTFMNVVGIEIDYLKDDTLTPIEKTFDDLNLKLVAYKKPKS